MEAVVDSRGAGDVFIGGVVAALAADSGVAEALACGCADGTVAVMRMVSVGGGREAPQWGRPTELATSDGAAVVQLAWAGGASANLADFFVALADHPEWGHAHTVFGEVVDADMAVADRIVQLPRRTNKPARPSDPEVTQLVEPVPFALRLS